MALTYKEISPTSYSLGEAAKEVGRYLVFGVVAEIAVVVIPVLLSGINNETGEIAMNWQLAYAVGLTTFLTAILRGLDKFKHLKNKINSPEKTGKSLGILPF